MSEGKIGNFFFTYTVVFSSVGGASLFIMMSSPVMLFKSAPVNSLRNARLTTSMVTLVVLVLVGWVMLMGITFGFRRNLDVARNGRSEGQKRVQPIAIDYHTVAGTAGAECKGDRRLKGPDSRSPEWTPTALQRHKGEET